MAQEKLKLLFFGTSSFAVHALEALRQVSRFSLLAVICPPDKAQGRGRKVQPNVMNTYCLSKKIPVLQPHKLIELKPYLQEHDPQVGLVVAYGKILPPWMFDQSQVFSQGLYNVHASLLPRYRGASPIHGALMSEERETGLSIQKMVSELDAGPVWISAKTSISDEDTLGILEEKLLGLLPGIIQEFGNRFPPKPTDLVPQSLHNISYAPKLSAPDWTFDLKKGLPSWPKLRAFIPSPGVWLTLGDQPLFKVCNLKYIKAARQGDTPLSLSANEVLQLNCQDGHTVQITEIQMPGRPKLICKAWLNGHRSLIQELSNNHMLSIED